ncbi:threonine aldolase family protein [Arsenicicoccus sp. oral taxon 190]|uniref:threonine aldolase family protein n=1 Tax=Arsenicicoccus sp. oral taxon 190 TaxID=1658671 RepID=UPI00067A3AC6|nr:beta-eliminating lyase-related protein [Arsenicicoccus sp. oral taxon 190]AKT50513.1 threonine aldolase [Arsenicicoccus sp. oral taxon 190]
MERLHDVTRTGFASDNYAGVHPAVLDALAVVNGGHVGSYGADPYTAALQDVTRRHFGEQASCWPVFNGTGANVVALSAMTDRWDAVIATGHAHIHVDECGAPEKVAGIKVVTVDSPDAIMTPALIDREAYGFGFEHHAQPRVVSITQSTEVGTVHTLEQVRAVTEHAHALGMVIHMDGARIANAAAALKVSLREMTTDVGVDVVSLGGTKAGLMGVEAVVVVNPDAVRRMDFVRKLSMQLASKMRFLSAQLLALYSEDLWLETARHANAMARRLGEGLRALDGVTLTQEVAANGVFAVIPPQVTLRMQAHYPFYVWDEATHVVRLMCSWDTTPEDVDGFVAALAEELAREGDNPA